MEVIKQKYSKIIESLEYIYIYIVR